MKRFKSTLGIILAIVMVSMTIFPATVAHAAGTMAFSVGTDYGGLFGIDTSSDATNARDLYTIAGYNSYASTAPTVSIMKGNFNNGTKRMKSDILFFSGVMGIIIMFHSIIKVKTATMQPVYGIPLIAQQRTGIIWLDLAEI